MVTSDKDIRQVIHKSLAAEYRYDKNALIVHELKVCQGEARIDIALVNGAMHGYEIKSDRDTLERLYNQIGVYNRVFDTITLVAGASHLEDAAAEAPPWWGIKAATLTDAGIVEIQDVREPDINTKHDAFALAQFLWRAELLDLLSNYDIDKKVKRLTRPKLWAYVADHIPLDDIRKHVRHCLRGRTNWRPDALRMSGDGLC